MMKKSILGGLLAAVALHAAGQAALEIIPLRHRTVDQVLPALRLLLEPGGTLGGDRGQLFVRASPGNVAELKQALAAIDRPLRRLQISVRFEDSVETSGRDIAADARVSNRSARIDLRAQDNRGSGIGRIHQRIQVLEGGRALIMTGQSTPLAGGIWETGSGFEVLPRLAGDTVLLDIAPQKETLDRQQRIATTVSARLGDWFELGGAVSSSERSSETRRVWLKVEELP